jgi:hypothetical protein
MRQTPGKGSGSFAIEKIIKGEVVASFGGFVVGQQDLKDYSTDRVARSLQLDEANYLLSGPIPESGDMINHSCEPNCGAFGTSSVIAMTDIEIGQKQNAVNTLTAQVNNLKTMSWNLVAYQQIKKLTADLDRVKGINVADYCEFTARMLSH